MTVWFESIIKGIVFFICISPISFIAVALKDILKKHKSLVKYILDQMFIAYLLVVLSLVFLPLPDAEAVAELTEYKANLIPLKFVYDIFHDRTVTCVCQVLFNIAMMIPFGMYMNYCTSFNKKKTVIFTFGLSLFIELGQLTGLFFMYGGSYRLFDVNDLILNTLGGLIGYIIIACLESYQTSAHKVPGWKIALGI